MFRDLKDLLNHIPKNDTSGFEVTVEEMIDAPFVSVFFDKSENKATVYKSNGEELSLVDIILNSMYADIKKFTDSIFEKLKDETYSNCQFGMFYFPCTTPRSITYPKYDGKYMLSCIKGDLDEFILLHSDEKWLKITTKITEFHFNQKAFETIFSYAKGDCDKFFTASMLTGEYKRINKDRSKLSEMEGIVLKTPFGNYKLSLKETKGVKDVSERKMCRDLILKDFIRWYNLEGIKPINDTYQNIVCNLFIRYVNATDITTRYSFEPKYLTPPFVGYMGDISYEWLDNAAVVEICKHNDIMKGIFRILLNALRKPLKKMEGDILTNKDVDEFNSIVEIIKTEVI